MLDPEKQPRPAPAVSAVTADSPDSAPATAVAQADDAAQTVSNTRPDSAHLQLKAEAIALLQTYYGNSAAQKVAEIEAKFPPLTEPVLFLDGCRQLAALLVGTLKANEVFKGLYDRL
jgi:hypothetical protein